MISTVQGLVEIPVEISLLVQPGALLLASRENYPPRALLLFQSSARGDW